MINSYKSFSQENEDLFLASLFPSEYNGFYVDIGAHHPTRFSNTALFYEKGWRGINVEANGDIFPEFERERIYDLNLPFLVSDKCRKTIFYEFDDPALNTAIKRRSDFLKKSTRYKLLRRSIKKSVSLKNLFKKYLPKNQKIDFLNVDTEGNELEVLKGNNWFAFRPVFLLVEILEDNLAGVQNHKVTKFLETKAYIPIAKIGRTTIFKDKKINQEPNKKALNQGQKLYILCPFFARETELANLVHKLKSQTYQNFHLILINCNKNGKTPFFLRSKMINAILLFAENCWWAQALEVGYKYLKALPLLPNSFVLILNQDVDVEKNFLESGVESINRLKVDLLGAASFSKITKKIEDTGVFWNWSDSSCRGAADPQEINCLSTRGLLIRGKVFLELGGFRPWLLPHYLSDYAYTVRAFRKGYQMTVCKKFRLFHQTESSFPANILKVKLGARLRYLFSNQCKANPWHRILFIWSSFPNLKNKISATKKCFREARKMILGNPEFLK